jgi:hypothetical protein
MSTPAPASPGNPKKDERLDHRLGSATVVLIIVAAIIVAVGATAAVIFSGPETVNAPPDTSGIGSNAPKASGQLPGAPSLAPKPTGFRPSNMQGFTGGSGMPAPQRPALRDIPLEAFKFGNGIPLEVPGGWSIAKQGDTSVQLQLDGGGAGLFVVVGSVKSRDIAKVFAADIKETQKDLNNVEVQSGEDSDKIITLKGSNFPQMLLVGYTADATTQQGTLPLTGAWIELFNAQTGSSAFLDYFAVDVPTFKAHASDIDAIIGSMA